MYSSHLAKKENGGYLQLYLDRQAELVQQGIDPLEAMAQVMYGVDGSVKTLPGLPPMYDCGCDISPHEEEGANDIRSTRRAM